MTDTPFKVGETYKTRGGEDAVVLAIDFDLEFPLIVKVKSHGRWAMFYRRADGRISETSDFTCDILPPRRGGGRRDRRASGVLRRLQGSA